MNATKMMEIVLSMLETYAETVKQDDDSLNRWLYRAMDEIKRDPAGWNARNPGYTGASIPAYKFFGCCAELLADARANMQDGHTSRDTVAALKRIIKGTPKHLPNMTGIIPTDAGRYAVCDGVRLVELIEDVPALPHCEDPRLAPENLKNGFMFRCGDERFEIPAPKKADLKAHLAAEKAAGRSKSKGANTPCPYTLTTADGDPVLCIDAQYALDMLDILPGGKWYVCGVKNPLFIEAETGRGLLLPCRPDPEDEKNLSATFDKLAAGAAAEDADLVEDIPAPVTVEQSAPVAEAETPAEGPEDAAAVDESEKVREPAPDYIITENGRYNSIEIRFSAKPPEAVRDALKAAGFRWHKKSGLWYGYEGAKEAREIIEAASRATMGEASTETEEAVPGGCKVFSAVVMPPAKNKYAQLADDLAAAYNEAFALYGAHDDGGTCNFDSPAIKLPRWNEAKTEAAAKASGLQCWKWDLWGTKRFVFSLPGECGQGMRRTLVAEAMTKALRRMGYDAMDYCQAD